MDRVVPYGSPFKCLRHQYFFFTSTPPKVSLSQTMPPTPLLPIGQGPRVIVYHQTHHLPDSDTPVSLLPLLTNNTGITHVIVAALHLNNVPGDITLNDHPPDHEKFDTLWAEVAWLQASGVKVLGMLGGAAKGTYARLNGDDIDYFERFYVPLRDVIRSHSLSGLDLDVEEPMSLTGINRLIDRLRADFGPKFLITLAPVATALLPLHPHLSGFSYFDLETQRGNEIAWYNTQFYCGWGDASTTFWYDAIITSGWKAEKVVMGLITSPTLGAGFVPWEKMASVLRTLRSRYPTFGGVMGWEYFCAEPGGQERPWEWVEKVAGTIRTAAPLPAPVQATPQQQTPIRPFDAPLPQAQHPFPAESVRTLQDLGFGHQQAVAALNMTNGNVEQAAGLLFED